MRPKEVEAYPADASRCHSQECNDSIGEVRGRCCSAYVSRAVFRTAVYQFDGALQADRGIALTDVTQHQSG